MAEAPVQSGAQGAGPGLQSLHGVGPKVAEQLAAAGIRQISDLLFHLPFRYEDRTEIRPIGSLVPGQRTQVEGKVEHCAIVRGRRPMLVVVLADGSGRVTLRFFHFRAAQRQTFAPGVRLRCFGEARAGARGLEMVHPSYRRVADGDPTEDRLTPIYPTIQGLKQHRWMQLTDQALQWLDRGALDLPELLPAELARSLSLPPLREAIQRLHRPPVSVDIATLESGSDPWRRRLALEELLAHHLSMRRLHERQQRRRAPALDGDPELLLSRFHQALPFRLTGAQQRVDREIAEDLGRDRPMLRLLQGDVGSGKTVVAALAALRAAAAGYQTAITAPTEILAEQHYQTLKAWLEPLGLEIVWLSGKVLGRARQKALERLADGAAVAVGTHALMQETVSFRQLGLVIVDEQHRFGVHQRLALKEKGRQQGRQPHQLIMTATPIPRTLAMTAYAGLAVSVIDELPPGRQPVTTVAVSQERRVEVIRRIAGALGQRRQAYWVCTVIEDSDKLEAEAAEQTLETLRDALPEIRIGLVHGRLRPKEKAEVMQAFKQGEIDLLVATTVIEVGVDVPNASLMIIDNAERLGLSQLHQLRGRVGRGHDAATCVLVYRPPLSDTAKARLSILRETNDGFRIAEQDLELRGPGEVLGTRQTGAMQFRIADLARDQGLFRHIPKTADTLLREHPGLARALVERWIGEAGKFAEV